MNDAGVALVKAFEGCKLTAYACPANVPTIGYGHTGPDVARTEIGVKTITQEDADILLAEDLAIVEMRVRRLLLLEPTSNQLAALVSFAYNCGTHNLRESTLLRLFNTGDIQGAADQFPRWNKAGGKVIPGLIARRDAERRLFLTED
jgi:lysozyme